jgi:hypothetical protein
MSSSAKKSSMKTGAKKPNVQAYQSVHYPERVITNPMEVSVYGESMENVIDRDFRPIPGSDVKKTNFGSKSRLQEFSPNNEPSKIKKIGAGNVAVPTLRLVGYTPEGEPIYDNAETPKYIKQLGNTKHPKSNPKLKKTHVHVQSNHTTEDPMEEGVHGRNNAGYVAVYHRANKPPINNNNKPSGGKASGAPGRRGILKSGTKKTARVALDPQTIAREFENNNAPKMVGTRDVRQNEIRKTVFGPKGKPKRSRKVGRN